MPTLPVFNTDEKATAHLYLASQVAEMMGRKLEEEDWSKVYRCVKGIADNGWSNLNIDIMHGALGVEHKMMRFNDSKPILDACGTTLMHPAGTRAIRIPNDSDATNAARDVLRQYAELIAERTAIVRTIHAYNHNTLTRSDAVRHLLQFARMSNQAATKLLPTHLLPVGGIDDQIDMRQGWLLWQSDLREFLYFEEPMTCPIPGDYVAEWKTSGGGRRRASRTLWVYHQETGEKRYSITTDAGAKIQPYFRVPIPGDSNLYHWIVQGEVVADGKVRVWLSRQTAALLQASIGSTDGDAISHAIRSTDFSNAISVEPLAGFGPTAIEVILESQAYQLLNDSIKAIGDEHRFRLFAEILRGPS